jgi:putative sterol carrier protein
MSTLEAESAMKSNPSEVYFNRLAKSGYQQLLHRVSGTLRFDIDQEDGDVHTWYVKIDHGTLDVSRADRRGDGVAAAPAADCVLAGSESEFDRILTGKDSFAAAFVRGAVSVQGDHTLAQNIRRFSPPAEPASQPEKRRHVPTDEQAPATKRKAPEAESTPGSTHRHVEQSESGSWPTTKQ